MTAATPEAAPLRDRLETLAAQWHATAKDIRVRSLAAKQDRALSACLRGQADGIQACADALEGMLDEPDGGPW